MIAVVIPLGGEMFEIVKIIAQTMAKSFSVDALLKMRKDRSVNEIGTELFLTYSALNNIVVTGREVVRELESALDWLKRKAESGEPDRELFTHIDFLLQQQKVNILNFIRSLKRMGSDLHVIAPEAFIRLAPLMFGKHNALSTLLNAIADTHTRPRLVSLDEKKMLELMEVAESYARGTDDDNFDRARHIAFQIEREHRDTLFGILIDEGVNNLAHIPARQHDVIKSYLERRQLAQVLDEIESIAKEMRKGIVDNFSLQDILLNVGDSRCTLPAPYFGF